jgi:NADPH:quinone reductase-like Zn-dependent oxidoreductase
MKAAVVHAFHVPPRCISFPEPIAAEQEVIVKVSAAALHPIVKSLADGTHYASSEMLPLITGVDGVGRLEDGSRVYFGMSRTPFGTFAEHSVTARGMCLPVPGTLDDVTVAAMMNPGMSSWAALLRAQFVAGESVLILGATGVAGQLAVQVAKRLGARRVVAAGRNPQVLEELRQRGADAVISLSQEREAVVSSFRGEWVKDKFDVVLDYVWGNPAESLLEAISQRGRGHAASRVRFVQVGASAGPTITLPAAALRSGRLELIGSGFGSVSMEQIFAAVADFLSEAEKQPFQIKTNTAPLQEVEALWNSAEPGVRLVFQP